MRRNIESASRLALAFAVLFLLAPAPVGAEGLLEFLFGPEPTPAPQAPVGPSSGRRKAVGELRYAKPKVAGSGFATEPNAGGFCVRTCDGYFFPLIKSTRATRQQSCELACPSATMEIYDGATIETARNRKGQRYTALPRAFAFRDRASQACACNDPQTAQSRAEQAGENDPTLQSGDVLVETGGAFVYSGSKLVPLANAAFVSPQLRDRLRALLRRPAHTAAAAARADQTGSTAPRRNAP
jgi:Protein of unknown function (DUF2865)